MDRVVDALRVNALAPHAAAGGFAYVDLDEPAVHGRIVAVRAAGPGNATLIRRLVVEDEGPHAGRGEPRPARHGGDPRQRDDDPRRGGVRGAGGMSGGMVRRMKPAPRHYPAGRRSGPAGCR